MIYFRYDTKKLDDPDASISYQMAKLLQSWLNLPEPRNSDMEEAYEFTYLDVDFYVQYDPNSEKNPVIFPFLIEGIKENAGEAGEREIAARDSIQKLLKDKVDEIEVD